MPPCKGLTIHALCAAVRTTHLQSCLMLVSSVWMDSPFNFVTFQMFDSTFKNIIYCTIYDIALQLSQILDLTVLHILCGLQNL